MVFESVYFKSLGVLFRSKIKFLPKLWDPKDDLADFLNDRNPLIDDFDKTKIKV